MTDDTKRDPSDIGPEALAAHIAETRRARAAAQRESAQQTPAPPSVGAPLIEPAKRWSDSREQTGASIAIEPGAPAPGETTATLTTEQALAVLDSCSDIASETLRQLQKLKERVRDSLRPREGKP